ncbi:MAG: hypothetical protein PHE53_00425 [Thermoguttaceae bacterium]|nr:hypothetical protein [Thermoguttaceae bacterium]
MTYNPLGDVVPAFFEVSQILRNVGQTPLAIQPLGVVTGRNRVQ